MIALERANIVFTAIFTAELVVREGGGGWAGGRDPCRRGGTPVADGDGEGKGP